jgi:hypothetical protein
MILHRFAPAVLACLLLAACGAGTPATVTQATETLREEMADDEYSVAWVGVVAKGEPGNFRATVDRVKTKDPDSSETQLCDASVSTNSHSYTCNTVKPAIMTQAANLLIGEYASKGVQVRDYHLERSGNGNAFTGYFELVDPATSESVRVPCKGDQKETDYTIDCDPSYADEQKMAT